jgi:hypothetical protein
MTALQWFSLALLYLFVFVDYDAIRAHWNRRKLYWRELRKP